MDSDFLIIGGGVAGLSAGARLARHGRVTIVEAEAAIGYHSSGRSATFSHFGIGDPVVRALTHQSRSWFLAAGDRLARTSSALYVATEAMLPILDQLEQDMRPYALSLRRAGPDEMRRLFPPLRIGAGHIVAGLIDPEGLRLDSDALLQGFRRDIIQSGGTIETGQAVDRLRRKADRWTAETNSGSRWSSPILINAAGAWADRIARLAGARPIGLQPMRRTIIVVDAPAGADPQAWPFVKTAQDDFYILPESGRLMASPVDEIASDPCDAQPEELDVARAAAKVEQYTTLEITRIAHRWAGLRSFVPDRHPVVGFDPDLPGFFWIAGQGGAGLQTSPALAEAAESLITGSLWPAALSKKNVVAAALAPDRLRKA